MTVRGRYAPTPSGDLHLGNCRTALLAWLSVRAQGGSFVLRLEDLDKQREKPNAAEQILSSLRWLGLDWDEGPDVGGPYGPYVQSERQAIYDAAVRKLLARGSAFNCFCSRSDVAAASTAPHAGDDGPRYPGTCRGLDPEVAAARMAQGKSPSIRFVVGPDPVEFVDQHAGAQRFSVREQVGDFVIRRADGVASYQLAVTLDDAAMSITEVVRGEDLLSSTPRQLLLYQALSLRAPKFLHVPLLLGPDGERLAKRRGAVSLHELQERQEDPRAICGLLASLSGLAKKGDRVTPKELISRWDPKKLPRQPSRLEEEDLVA